MTNFINKSIKKVILRDEKKAGIFQFDKRKKKKVSRNVPV
jgi:hypothetical protein